MDKTTTERPWWAPDAQGFLACAIVALCGAALFIRMFSPSQVDDKILDMMITILFSTCLVMVYNFKFGSSQSSQSKDEARDKVTEKLMATALPTNGTGSGAAVTAAAEKAAPPAAAVAAPPAVDAELDKRGITDPHEPPKP